MEQSEKPTIERLTSLKGPLSQTDELIEGYCFPMDGEDFRVYVAKRVVGPHPGYNLNITCHWGDDIGISLDNANLYPQANAILNKFNQGEWFNADPLRRASKSLRFGMEEKDKDAAIEMMHQIIKEVKL
ncbi:MAG: hypothetical protein J5641_01320 [Bacteroidales bacterium]|nr:hypothetical protein [Bacteroidales bacterium]